MRHLLILLFAGTSLVACSSDDDPARGKIRIEFLHSADGSPLILNSSRYENAAGNTYEVTSVQWFISDLAFIDAIGREIAIDEPFCHYIDTGIPSTLNWTPDRELPSTALKKIRFTFGIKGEKNIPGLFTDMPESDMIWPYAMGGPNGGYHYMKLNGFWIDNEETKRPFNVHLGVGQIYNANHEVESFVQNWFEVELPIDLEILPDKTQTVRINMEIQSWFSSPHVYDHNVFGGMIMANQEAMGMLVENGADVFTADPVTQK